MNKFRIIVFITIQLLLTQALFAQDKLNQAWLDKDLQIFTNFLPVLKSGEFDLDALKKIKNIKVSDEDNIGLSYKKQTYSQGGGYSSISIKTLLDPNNNIVKYRIRIYGNINAINALDKKLNIFSLLSHYKDERYGDRITLELENTNNKLFSEMMICFDKYFGIKERVNIPATLINDYLLLTDPFNENTYGYVVGYSAATPRFRSAIERIKKENNNEILTLIMASPNPVGRVYAIEAICNGNINNLKNNKQYSNILNNIFKLKIPIEAGAGCIVMDITIDSYKNLNDAMRYVKFD